MKRKYKNMDLLGVKVHIIHLLEVLKEIEHAIVSKSTLTITAVNPDKINNSYKSKKIANIYNRFDIVTPDSIGTILGLKILGYKLNCERIPGRLLANYLYGIAKNIDIRFFFLGTDEKVIKQATSIIHKKYPWVTIEGYHHGYFNDEENIGIINSINLSNANVIFVGLGAPKENKWILENSTYLKNLVMITMGGYFDQVIRRINCYPKWINILNLRWIYRLIKDPKRLWKRYLIGNPLFLLRIFKSRLTNL